MSNLPAYVGVGGRLWHYGYRIGCGAILAFLVLPILITIPLSFNASPYFSYPLSGLSWRWYAEVLGSPVWLGAIKNSLIIGVSATAIATTLGVLAALGLSHRNLPGRGLITGLLVSPMVLPVVITAVGMYFFYTNLGLTQSLPGLVLAHAALGTPFVVVTVTATLSGFNESLIRASSRKRPLNIMLRPYFAQKWLVPRLDTFWAAHPDIDLQLIHSIHTPDNAFNQIDLAIQWTEAPPPDMESRLLVEGGLSPVCHPRLLEECSHPPRPQDLSRHTILDEETEDNWNRWLGLAGVPDVVPRKRISIDDTNVRLHAAIDGQGFVLTCLSLLGRELDAGELVAPFETKLPDYAYFLVYPKRTLAKRHSRQFIDWLIGQTKPA